ncbi:hypothetical protein BD410DRAFT_809475 [Rickenella mellea]|uniref:Uncharacterized protein n=1 Tax=Rickenella mellea TaxID=50990 RepID=A0A4Y7PHA3_9AGAM|nr:hypothetical protein BD410DRAFT_809475 [Rickenella mellea]
MLKATRNCRIAHAPSNDVAQELNRQAVVNQQVWSYDRSQSSLQLWEWPQHKSGAFVGQRIAPVGSSCSRRRRSTNCWCSPRSITDPGQQYTISTAKASRTGSLIHAYTRFSNNAFFAIAFVTLDRYCADCGRGENHDSHLILGHCDGGRGSDDSSSIGNQGDDGEEAEVVELSGALNKSKKLVKKLAKRYNTLPASGTLIKQIPHPLGHGLSKDA